MGHRAATSERLVGRRSAWPAAAMLAVSVGLGGCSVPDWANPVEWYRNVSGASKGDPKPDARNTQNLKKGGEQPYPNLASVPPPPTNALSSAEREKLRNSLAADRANAKYLDSSDQYVPTPPKVVSSPPLSAPEAAEAPAASPAPVQATPVPAPASAPTRSSSSPSSAQRGTEAPPQESSLTPPSVRSVPQGDTPRGAPPPPAGVPTRAQSQASQPLQRAPAPQPPPQPQQSAALPPQDPGSTGGGAALPGGVGVMLGSIQFTGNSAKLSPELLAQVREIAAVGQQNGGGTIRVTGYSEPKGDQDTMAPQLAS